MEFVVVGVVLLHPFHGAVVALAGLVLAAQLPVRHGQKETIGGELLCAEQLIGRAEGIDGFLPRVSAVLVDPEVGQRFATCGASSTAFLAAATAPGRSRSLASGHV